MLKGMQQKKDMHTFMMIWVGGGGIVSVGGPSGSSRVEHALGGVSTTPVSAGLICSTLVRSHLAGSHTSTLQESPVKYKNVARLRNETHLDFQLSMSNELEIVLLYSDNTIWFLSSMQVFFFF